MQERQSDKPIARNLVPFEVFDVEEMVGRFGASKEGGVAVFPAVGVAGEMVQRLAGSAEEGGHVVRQCEAGGLGNGAVADDPPSRRGRPRHESDSQRLSAIRIQARRMTNSPRSVNCSGYAAYGAVNRRANSKALGESVGLAGGKGRMRRIRGGVSRADGGRTPRCDASCWDAHPVDRVGAGSVLGQEPRPAPAVTLGPPVTLGAPIAASPKSPSRSRSKLR